MDECRISKTSYHKKRIKHIHVCVAQTNMLRPKEVLKCMRKNRGVDIDGVTVDMIKKRQCRISRVYTEIILYHGFDWVYWKFLAYHCLYYVAKIR